MKEIEIINCEDSGASTDPEGAYESAGLICHVSQVKTPGPRERNAVFHHRPSVLLEKECGGSRELGPDVRSTTVTRGRLWGGAFTGLPICDVLTAPGVRCWVLVAPGL